MAWSATKTGKYRDPINLNIGVEITYTDGTTTVVERFPGSIDLTEAEVAEQARKRIRNVLEVGDVTLATLTLGPIEIPPDPVVSPDQQKLMEAQRAFQVTLRDAQVKALNDPVAQEAFNKLKEAEVAVLIPGEGLKL